MTKKVKSKIPVICDYLSVGLLFFDKENKLSLINPRAENFLNIKAKEILNKPPPKLIKNSKLKPLLNLFFKKRFKEISQQEIKINNGLALVVSCFPILEKGKTFRKTQGKKAGTLVILEDKSREKEIERIKTQFISLAAHQFRTPLSAIKWGLRMVLNEELGELTQKQKTFLKKIYHSNERMIALVRGLAIVAQMEEGKYIIRPTPFQIEKIVQSVIDFQREKIERKKIKLKFKKPKRKLPEVFGDIKKIELAIQSLLENSLNYITSKGEITISLKGRKEKVEFKIIDTGFGIPKKQQKKVFEKFFRGANVARKGTEGSGLSLFLTKNIIEAHKGKIWFESQQNKGTTFYLTLPTAASLKK